MGRLVSQCSALAVIHRLKGSTNGSVEPQLVPALTAPSALDHSAAPAPTNLLMISFETVAYFIYLPGYLNNFKNAE